MSKRYYDVELRIFICGYEKVTTNRVCADSEEEAIIEGFACEAHNLSATEVKKALELSLVNFDSYELDDLEFCYHLDRIVPLNEVKVMIDGVEMTTLLPDADQKHYYVGT